MEGLELKIGDIVDTYLGMKPNDVGCKNWFIMRLNMIEEIKQLNLALVSDSADYWSARCRRVEKINSESPCDPDITGGQMQAHEDMRLFEDKHGLRDYR